MFEKSIVVDVDDTISTHVDRDYANAIPHADVIAKINEMYESGWKIILHTARGMLSCDNDPVLAEASRGPALRTWLKNNDVKYHELMFGKPLALAYIDDKAMRPDEFSNARFERIIGGSGAEIEIFNNRVIKNAPNAREQALWYKTIANKQPNVRVPRVMSNYNDTLDMEYIEGMSLNNCCTGDDLITVYVTINLIGNLPAISSDWNTMVDRIKTHLSINAIPHEQEILKIITSDVVSEYMTISASFCHGDMTFENAIVNRYGEVYFIDPNTPAGLYTSSLLDIGKVYQSLHFDYESVFGNSKSRINKPKLLEEFESLLTSEEIIYGKLCEMIHYIRMLKYKKNKFEKDLVRDIIDKLFREDVSPCF